MFSLPKLKDEVIQSCNNILIINNENSLHKVSYEYFAMKIPKQTIEVLLNSEKDERYLYFLRYGLLRRYEGKGDILYVEIPQIPKNLVIYRKPSIRNKFYEKLYLNKKDLPHVPLLEGEENLKLLSLESNNIMKIDHLISLNNLLFLNLYENKITEIENLQSVPKLKALMLGKNQISKIKNLNFLSDLEVLDLHSNKIKLIENLFSLKKLRILNLANNQLTSFLELMNNRNLEEINLRKNLIVSIPNLTNHFDQLKRMNIAKNMINKVEFILEFKKLRKLGELFIEENPVICQKDAYKKLSILPLKFKNPTLFRQFKNYSNETKENKYSNHNNSQNINSNINIINSKSLNSNNNNFSSPKVRSLSSINSQKNIKNNYDDISTTRTQTRNSISIMNLTEIDRKILLNKIEKEWDLEFKYIIKNGYNGYTIKKLKETKMTLCHAELEKDKQLNIFGNAIEVLGYNEFHHNIHTVQIFFLNYDLIANKINIENLNKFSHLKSLILGKNNLNNYYQLIKLENIKGIEYITITNNEICDSELLKYFLVYRFQNIKYFNNYGITEKDIIMSKKIFEDFDRSISENENLKFKKKNNLRESKSIIKNNYDSKQYMKNIKFLNFVKQNLSNILEDILGS